jgi:hypothetical protein
LRLDRQAFELRGDVGVAVLQVQQQQQQQQSNAGSALCTQNLNSTKASSMLLHMRTVAITSCQLRVHYTGP